MSDERDWLQAERDELEAIAERDALRADLERERFARRTIDRALLEAVAERDDLQARIDAYEGHLEEWEEIDRLIAASSLGTPEAVALMEQAPRGLGHAIVRGSQHLARAEAAEAERDRLRALVDAVREISAAERTPYVPGKEATIGRLFARLETALNQLDASPPGEDS